MLIPATDSAFCRKCNGPIRKGDQVSWVDPRDMAGASGPYHVDCTPLAEDASIARIASEAAAATRAELEARQANAQRDFRVPIASSRSVRETILLSASVAVACALLLLAASMRFPYDFYSVLRLVVAVTFALLARRFWHHRNSGWRLGLAAFAVLYNPLLPVHLARGIWVPVNIATAVVLLAALYETAFRQQRGASGA